MERTTNAYEAVLLYRSADDIELAPLAAPLADLANRFGFARGAVQKAGPADILFKSDEMTMVLSVVESPLSDPRFARAERPGAEVIPREEIAARIAAHKAAVVIRVTPGNRVTAPARALELCNETARILGARSPVSLAYWAETDKIFAGEEYRASTGGHAPIKPRRPERHYLRTVARPAVPRPELPLLTPAPAALPLPVELRPFEIEAGRIEAIRSDAFPRDAIRLPGDPHARAPLAERAVSAAAIAVLATPLALGALMQTLVASVKLG